MRPQTIATEAQQEMGGNALVSWARRESAMRMEARSVEPRHVQYAGDGALLLIPSDAKTIFMSSHVREKEPERW